MLSNEKMSDKVNEFLKELAPMKEAKFWHEFIAALMGGGRIPPSPVGSHYLIQNNICQTTTEANKEFDCSSSSNFKIKLNPPVPVFTKSAIRYVLSPTISPTPPPPSPPKPKFFKLFQPSVYTPLVRARSVQKITTKTWIPSLSPSILFLPQKFDGLQKFHHHHNNQDLLLLGSTINEHNQPYFYYNYYSPIGNNSDDSPQQQSLENMGEETSTDTDTLTETTLTIRNLKDSQTDVATQVADPLPFENTIDQQQQRENMPIDGDKFILSKQQESKSSLLMANENIALKPPLQRSFSEPNSSGEETSKINMLQKSPTRPIFTSSSFYDPSQHPTLEDQVKLCRDIAKQLVSDCANAKSKGREMFERRVQKSSRWITENEDSFQNYTTGEEDYHERTITDGPPNLRLLFDPRHVEDINSVQGVNEHIIAAQEAKTRDTCKNIVHDLTSPEVNPNRGKALFSKRVQKSEEWVVDDVAESVIGVAGEKLFPNVKQQSWSNNTWSKQSSPIPPPSSYSKFQIPGPVFTPVSLTSMSSRPSSSMSMRSQFRDFNARPKPFCRAY